MKFLDKLSNLYRPFKPHTQQKLVISYESEFVTMDFGGAAVTVHYRDALKIASLIFHKAKQCKRGAGDTSRDFHVLGELNSAEENDKHVRAHI